MAFHLMGGKTERLFSKGQRLLEVWRFDEAIAAFDGVLEADSTYARVRLYKALALAEQERDDEAIAQLEMGAGEEHGNFVFRLFQGCIHLDRGDVAAAARAFGEAASLSPGNLVVKGFQELAAHVGGDRAALSRLRPLIGWMPISLTSRLALVVPLTKDEGEQDDQDEDWLEARKRLAAGDRRLARRLFERCGRKHPLEFGEWIAEALENPKLQA